MHCFCTIHEVPSSQIRAAEGVTRGGFVRNIIGDPQRGMTSQL